MSKLKAFRLSDATVSKIAKIAKETHRTETYYVEQALSLYLDEYTDAIEARERFNDPKTEFITSKDMRKRLNV